MVDTLEELKAEIKAAINSSTVPKEKGDTRGGEYRIGLNKAIELIDNKIHEVKQESTLKEHINAVDDYFKNRYTPNYIGAFDDGLRNEIYFGIRCGIRHLEYQYGFKNTKVDVGGFPVAFIEYLADGVMHFLNETKKVDGEQIGAIDAFFHHSGQKIRDRNIHIQPTSLEKTIKKWEASGLLDSLTATKTFAYLRPKTRGELLNALKNNIKCEVVASNEEITNIMLDGWLNFESKYKTYPSENKGYVIYEAL